MQRFLPAHPPHRFALFLGLLCLAILALYRPLKHGDFQEYGLMTIALAEHASPDIRLSDLDRADRLSPEPGFVAVHQALRTGMARADAYPSPGFMRSANGSYYAIHFFAYPALAALPFKIIDALGGKPFKAYQVVNLAALAILASAMFRLTGSVGRALYGTAFFMLSGGVLYVNWASPEFFTACCLLAGLLFVLLQRPWLGALLAGLGAMQNPPLVFFALFAPLIQACYLMGNEGLPPGQALRRVLNRHTVLASVLQAALAGAPVLYNLAVWGVPSMIGVLSTHRELVTSARLVSFFFDLNQGVIIGFPVALLLVAVQLFAKDRRRWLAHTLAAVLFSVALAIPALSTVNWNSGANGLMRYAFWGAMPLLYLALSYLALSYLARLPRIPAAVLAAMLLVQLGAMKHARSYIYLEFSPAARAMLRLLPGWYAPEHEIFFERAVQRDGAMHPDAVASYGLPGRQARILFNTGSPAAHAALCGPGGHVALPADAAGDKKGWRYLTGRPACTREAQP